MGPLHRKDCWRKPWLIQHGPKYVSGILQVLRLRDPSHTVASKEGDGNLLACGLGGNLANFLNYLIKISTR